MCRATGIRKWPKEYLPSIFDERRVDRVMEISQREAEETMRSLARVEGAEPRPLFCFQGIGFTVVIALIVVLVNQSCWVLCRCWCWRWCCLHAECDGCVTILPGAELRLLIAVTLVRQRASTWVALGTGIFAGISSGGAISAALRLSDEVQNATIVAIVCDRGDR